MQDSLAFFALMLEKDFATFCNRRLQEVGMTQGLLYFILYIGKHPCCGMGDMTRELRMDWGHTQRSVDKLVQDGFVHKQKNEQDKRAYHLTLTSKGENAFSVSHQVFFDWDAGILQELSTKEKNHLFTLLEKLVRRKGEDTCVRNNQQPD